MSLPSIYDIAASHLMDSREKLQDAGLPAGTVARLIRIREAYNHCIDNPGFRDADVVKRICNFGGVRRSVAYDDLKVVKTLLGNLQQTSRDFHRYRFEQMILASYELAVKKKDPKAMAAAADKYAKYNRLDQPDQEERRWESIVIQPFVPTDDPSVIGIKPIENIRLRMKEMKESYWNEEVEDIEYEEADFNEEELFKPKQPSKQLPDS